jgi:predicted transcriptional regulator
MIRFLRDRVAKNALGHLEARVMEIVWDAGESNVHDVIKRLDRTLAYTTVMTTLDRLYKKGLLDRAKSERAFVYTPRLSRRDWEHQRTGDLVASIMASPMSSNELLVSCLVEAVGEHDEALLDELERKIRAKRKELSRRRQA